MLAEQEDANAKGDDGDINEQGVYIPTQVCKKLPFQLSKIFELMFFSLSVFWLPVNFYIPLKVDGPNMIFMLNLTKPIWNFSSPLFIYLKKS